MPLHEYVTLVQNSFPYLFEEYGFYIAIKEENRPGYFRIGLQSGKCRILFVREQGGGVMFFGPTSAAFNEDDRQWVTMAHLLEYFMKKEINWSSIENIPYQARMGASLDLMAKE
jgi:hypothetical protein